MFCGTAEPGQTTDPKKLRGGGKKETVVFRVHSTAPAFENVLELNVYSAVIRDKG